MTPEITPAMMSVARLSIFVGCAVGRLALRRFFLQLILITPLPQFLTLLYTKKCRLSTLILHFPVKNAKIF